MPDPTPPEALPDQPPEHSGPRAGQGAAAGTGSGPEPDQAAEAAPEPELGEGFHPIVAAMLAAAIFLTRLPLPFPGRIEPGLFGRAMGWFPLVGAALGLMAGLLFGLFGWFGLPPLLAAALTLTLLIAITGGLHEDGLADTADGFGGGRDREHKLGIMRDSRIGSYGALALLLGILLRLTALAALPSTWAAITVLACAGALSRAALVAASHWLPPARSDGLAATLGAPAKGATLLALVLAAALALLLFGGTGCWVLAAAGLATWAMIRLARAQIGGRTGDLLGATQQVVEITVMVFLVGLR